MNRTVFLFVTLLCLCFSCTGKKQEEKVLSKISGKDE